VYRLTAVDRSEDGLRLGFGLGRYFEATDVGEAAAHEYAAAVRRGDSPTLRDLPFRSRIGDPTEVERRSMTGAITTVTVRRSAGSQFLLHWRDPAKVAANAGMYQVLPVGVFQPLGSPPDGPDFSLWRGMVREFSEEIIGEPEHHQVDYETTKPGRCTTHWNGRVAAAAVGSTSSVWAWDPLSLATDLLTIAVFEADVFDALFGNLVSVNAEGTTTQVPFTDERVG
jgi:hypothetical protein